jgi:hypothetical protein
MQLRAILIDPARQKISELRIPRSPDKQLVINSLSQLIGCATMKFAWISHAVGPRLAFCQPIFSNFVLSALASFDHRHMAWQ